MCPIPSFLLSDVLADEEAAPPNTRRAFLAQATALGATLGGVALVGCNTPSPQGTSSNGAASNGAAANGADSGHQPAGGGAPGATVANPDSKLDTMQAHGSHATTAGTAGAAAAPPYRRYDPTLPPLASGRTLQLHWEAREVPLHIRPDTVIHAWTFEGDVPGPIVHCRVGDTVEFTLTNRGTLPHSMDFHAAQIDPKTAFRSVMPGESVTYTFRPRYAGAFLYHCGTSPVLMHLGSGMYGAIIVSPAEPLPAAKEFVLVQNEFYLNPAENGVQSSDYNKMLNRNPDIVAFNGRPGQYQTEPIRVKRGDRVRFYVVSAGPSHPCNFHIVGEQFDSVYLGAPPGSAIHGVQTFGVAPGGGMIFELVADVAGEFPFVNHGFGHGQKGAIGFLVVEV